MISSNDPVFSVPIRYDTNHYTIYLWCKQLNWQELNPVNLWWYNIGGIITTGWGLEGITRTYIIPPFHILSTLWTKRLLSCIPDITVSLLNCNPTAFETKLQDVQYSSRSNNEGDKTRVTTALMLPWRQISSPVVFHHDKGGNNPFDDDSGMTSAHSKVSRIHDRDLAQACTLITEVINFLEIRFSADFITGPNAPSSSLVAVKITQKRRIRCEWVDSNDSLAYIYSSTAPSSNDNWMSKSHVHFQTMLLEFPHFTEPKDNMTNFGCLSEIICKITLPFSALFLLYESNVCINA